MSWKMFFQIVLLIIITAVVMLGTKCALYKGKLKCHMMKDMKSMHMQK